MSAAFSEENFKTRQRFSEVYDVIGIDIRSRTKERILTVEPGKLICRYCGRDESATSFKKEAHAISVFLGNTVLIDPHECDACNEHFGSFVEDHFAKYTLPFRTFSRVRGRQKIPSFKNLDYEIRAENEKNLVISALKIQELGEIKFNGHSRPAMKFSLRRPPYVPIGVYKTFVKLALALMPEEDHKDLEVLKQWILTKDHVPLFSGSVQALEWHIAGPMNPNRLICYLGKAKPESAKDYFKYVLILAFGNQQYQVVIPDLKTEVSVTKTFVVAPVFMPDEHFELYGDPYYKTLNLFVGDTVRDEVVDIVIQYESASEE